MSLLHPQFWLPALAGLFMLFPGIRLQAQDKVLLVAEKIRAEMHAVRKAGVSAGNGQDFSSRVARCQAQLDSLFAAQEAILPSRTYLRRPSVKAPEGALELLRHERHAIIDYFIGPEMLHVFVITRKETHYRVVPHPPDLQPLLDAFRCSVSRPGSDPGTYQRQAHALYEWLLSPLEDLTRDMDQLTIIPDVRLEAIPLGALVRREVPHPEFRRLSYLLHDFGIGYALSAAHLAEVQEMGRPRGSGLALFLIENEVAPELERIRRHWDSETFDLAGDLRHRGPEAGLIHLAGTSGRQLSPRELAGLDLDAALVTISDPGTNICTSAAEPQPVNTGLEMLCALETAGVRCMVWPAWEMEENARAGIWGRFYRSIGDCQYVDQALRFAKLDYLESAPDERTHPAYWAGLLQFDDFSPVKERGHFPWYVFLVGGFLLVVFLGKRL